MKAFEWINASSVSEAVQLLTSAPAPRDIDDAARPIAADRSSDHHERLHDAASAGSQSQEHSRPQSNSGRR